MANKILFIGLIAALIFVTGNTFAQSVNYYFDAANGNDNNTGTSAAKPFKTFKKLSHLQVNAGDSILLKSGVIFADSLFFSGKGLPGKPIVIGKYGGNAKPHLKGNAARLQMVHIYNSENIVIRDLEISNKGKNIRPHLSGLLVELKRYGIARNITIENLFVHDVYGSLIKGEGRNDKDAGGGQAIMIKNVNEGETDSVLSCFDGLLVLDCYIKNSQRNGIMMWGNWVRKFWFPSKNVVIRKNIIDGVPGDGIVLVGCERPLVEYNVMKNSPLTLPASEACDGIWPWSCDNAIIQYNIVSGHKSQVDGYPLDADYNCTNSLFQYNLTYNNDGGFLLLCNSGGWPAEYSVGNTGTVVKYNISINDGIRKYIVKGKPGYFSPLIHIAGPTQNSKIENNLFYVKKKPLADMDKRIICSDDWNGYADSTFFILNFLYTEEPTLAFDPAKSTSNFFETNYYIGPLSTPEKGFDVYKGKFNKKMWYNAKDENWQKLIAFIKNKTVLLDGKEVQVLKLIGWQ